MTGKRLVLSAVAVPLLLVLGGCSGKDESRTEKPPPPSRPTPLTSPDGGRPSGGDHRGDHPLPPAARSGQPAPAKTFENDIGEALNWFVGVMDQHWQRSGKANDLRYAESVAKAGEVVKSKVGTKVRWEFTVYQVSGEAGGMLYLEPPYVRRPDVPLDGRTYVFYFHLNRPPTKWEREATVYPVFGPKKLLRDLRYRRLPGQPAPPSIESYEVSPKNHSIYYLSEEEFEFAKTLDRGGKVLVTGAIAWVSLDTGRFDRYSSLSFCLDNVTVTKPDR